MELQSIIQNIGAFTHEAVAIADVDPDDGAILTFLWLNPAFTRLTGYSLEDLAEKTAGVLTGPDTDKAIHESVIRRLMDWQHFNEELVLHRKTGTSFWSSISFQPLEDEKSAYRFWILTIRDITSRKRVEEQQRDLALIAQATQDMVMVMDAERQVLWVNRSFVEFTGFHIEEVRGRRISDFLIPPQADKETAAAAVEMLDQKKPVFSQILCHKKDGGLYLGEYEIQPVFDSHGKLLRFVCLHRDVTERTSLEWRYDALLNQTGIITYIKHQGRFLMVNKQLEELFDRQQDWFCGKTDCDVTGSPNGSLMGLDEDYVYRSGENLTGERQIRLPDGTMRTYIARLFRLFDPTLNDHLVCCMARDVTMLKSVEKKLRYAQADTEAARQRLMAALDVVPDGFALNDRSGRLVMANAAFHDLHKGIEGGVQVGMSVPSIMKRAVEAGIWDTEGLSADAWVAERLTPRENGLSITEMRKTVDGRVYFVRVLPISNGEIATLWADFTEIKDNEHQLKIAQKRAETAQARLTAAIEALGDSIVIFDADDRVVMADVDALQENRSAAEHRQGRKYEDIIREAVGRGNIADAFGREEEWIKKRLAQHTNPGKPLEQTLTDGRCFRIIERKTANGDTVRLSFDITQEKEQQQQLEQYAAVLKSAMEVAEQRNRELEDATATIEHASLHDALTDLANRRYLDQELDRRIAAWEAGGQGFAVLHIDLDRFKQINDTLGHDAGDKLLQHVADVLRATTRDEDFAARVGGDEFVILAEHTEDSAELARFASRIIMQMRKPILYNGHELRFGASIGIAVASPRDDDPRQVLINADMALYKAKQAGRNRWAFFSDVMHSELIETKRLADRISRALDKGEFKAQYQPQFTADGSEIVGVEALVRWAQPDGSQVLPEEFLKVAEEMNQLRAIDRMVLERVSEDWQRWQRAGITIPKVSVNVSSRRLRDSDLIEDIRSVGFPPGCLSVEVLESIFIDEEDEKIAWNVDQLRDMGVTIELDDFGTGHSSIIGLIKLKPARLKIDRQFITPMLESADNTAIVRSIIEIGHSLNVEVVAEGVEKPEQAKRLHKLKCDVIQGFVFARPMSSQKLIDFVSARQWEQVG
ncbi:EAL domain-containing protein [Halovulum sp. GXIMD14793]